MLKRVLLNIIVLCLFSVVIYAQNDRVFDDYAEAMVKPGDVRYVDINCDMPDNYEFINNIGQFTNLINLKLTSFNEKKLPEAFYKLAQLRELNIVKCQNIDYDELFEKLDANSSLEKISIANIELIKLPDEIVLLDSLKALSLSGIDKLNLSHTVDVLSEMQQLKDLSLPVNQLTELPENIGKLKQLNLLDLSNNYLSDLPRQMASLSGLDTLYIEENVIIDPVKSFGNIGKLNLKFLSLDPGLSDEESRLLQLLFPDAKIVEATEYLTKATERNQPSGDNESTQNSNTRYGKLKIEDTKVQVLSTAYLHYPDIFTDNKFKIRYDSMAFEERYKDTSYVNFIKKQPGVCYSNIHLEKYKKNRKGFTIESVSFGNKAKYFAELMAFNGYYWMQADEYTGKEFRKKFCKKGLFSKTIQWHDVRVYYNEELKNFTIELKSDSNHIAFTALLMRYVKNSNDLESAQENYVQIYTRYMKTLDRRKKRLHNKLIMDKSRLEKALIKRNDEAWKDFCKMYMSDEEKKMSQDEWLEYFDRVIANEKKAIHNAPATIEFIKRSMTKEGFTGADRIQQILNNDDPALIVYSLFNNKNGDNLAVSKILVINTQKQIYFEYKGDLGLDETQLYLDNSGNNAIVIELRNGDVGILTQEDFEKINFLDSDQYLEDRSYSFTMEIIQRKLGSVGQVMKLLKL